MATTLHYTVAEYLDEALGDMIDDVAFTTLVDDVVEDLGRRIDAVCA